VFDLDLDAGEHRSARAALRTIKQYGDAVDYHERALRLSIAGGQRDRACKHLERLCKASDGAEDTVGQAVELFDDAGWGRHCESVLWKLLAVGHGVGKSWVRLALCRRSWKGLVRQVGRLPHKGRRQTHAGLALAGAAGPHGKQ